MPLPSSTAVRELPLFPLPEVVLFPGRPLPLHIFEFRYRIMMNTILEGDRRFGVLLWDQVQGQPALVGCCAEIIQFQRMPDDRMKILTLGQQRFRVLDYVREKPYRVGLVEWIEDHPPEQNLKPLAQDVGQLLQDVVRLSAKLTGQEIELPDAMPDLPIELPTGLLAISTAWQKSSRRCWKCKAPSIGWSENPKSSPLLAIIWPPAPS